jgi:hypothetical protein
MRLEQLELEGNPPALGPDGEDRRGAGRPGVADLRSARSGGVGQQAGARRAGPEALELVLDEGPEELAHVDLGHHGVARLLQPEDEVSLDLRGFEQRRVEVALLHPPGVEKDDAARPQLRGGLEDPAQHLGPGHRQEQVEAGRRRRVLGEPDRQANLFRLDGEHRPPADRAVDPANGEVVADPGTVDLVDVARPAAGEPRGAVRVEIGGEEEDQVHGRAPSAGATGTSPATGRLARILTNRGLDFKRDSSGSRPSSTAG